MGSQRLILLVFMWCSLAAICEANNLQNCKIAQNCSSCIQTPNCIWCGKPGEFGNGEQTLLRCVDRAGSSLDEWTDICGKTNIHSPEDFYQGWEGDACECRTSKKGCMNPDSGAECSGNGECECDQCKCIETEDGRYSGKWCEDCPTCSGKCVLYRSCVQCQVFGTGPFNEDECATNCILFNSTPVDVAIEEEDGRVCSFFDENDCRFIFVYGYDENREPVVRVRQTLDCPPKLETSSSADRACNWLYTLKGLIQPVTTAIRRAIGLQWILVT